MKKFYVMYSENLQNKEATIEAYGREHAKRVFKELYGDLYIIQLKELVSFNSERLCAKPS